MRRPPALAACLASVLLILCPRETAHGDEEEEDDEARFGIVEELFLGEAPQPQEAGELQLTFQTTFLEGGEADSQELRLEFEYGLSSRFQLGIELPYLFLQPNEEGEPDQDGFGDLSFSVLYAMVNQEDLVISPSLEISLPTGDEDEELSEGVVEVEPSVLAGVAIGDGEFHLGVGGELSEDDQALTYQAAVVWPFSDLAGVLEVTGSAGGEEHEAFLTPGVYWRGWDDVQLGVGAPIGLTSDSPDWGVTIVLAVEF